jgi:hypothetical protein
MNIHVQPYIENDNVTSPVLWFLSVIPKLVCYNVMYIHV